MNTMLELTAGIDDYANNKATLAVEAAVGPLQNQITNITEESKTQLKAKDTTIASLQTALAEATKPSTPASTPLVINDRYTLVGEAGKIYRLTGKGKKFGNLAIRGTLKLDDMVMVENFEILGQLTSAGKSESGNQLQVAPGAAGSDLRNGRIVVEPNQARGNGVMILGSVITRNLEISGTFDGFHVAGAGVNWTDYGSWVHGLNWLLKDTGQNGGPSHPDCSQIATDGEVELIGTYLDASDQAKAYAAIQMTWDTVNGAKRWPKKFYALGATIKGGNAPINFAGGTDAASAIPDLQFIDCIFGYSSVDLGGRKSAGVMKKYQKSIAKFTGSIMDDGKALDISNG